MPYPAPARLVLASTSRYRRELLSRLNIPFEVTAPAVDEAPLAGEAPQALALRLACLKAQSVRQAWPDALIVGSDQVAVVGESMLGKPGNFDRAAEQLKLMRAQTRVLPYSVVLAQRAHFARTDRSGTSYRPHARLHRRAD